MDLKWLKARGNWSRICSKRDLARVRTHTLPMTVLWLVVFCTLPSANRAQVLVYEVTPVESTIKCGVDSSVPIKRYLRQMERKHPLHQDRQPC
jgi:hypothetical protein